VNILGNNELKERYSLTSHIVKRWRQRIEKNITYDEIREKVDEIIDNGIKRTVDDKHYRICYKDICVVFMKLSPLHSLAKTVYIKSEEEFGCC
jgi:hypothetical protein